MGIIFLIKKKKKPELDYTHFFIQEHLLSAYYSTALA